MAFWRLYRSGTIRLVAALATTLALGSGSFARSQLTPAGAEFQVNRYTTGGQWGSVVASDAEGNFVVVWVSLLSNGSDGHFSIQARRFGADGVAPASDFQVDGYTTGEQTQPAIASDAEGNFVVVWTSTGSYGTDTEDESIQGRRFDASGIPQGPQFQVNRCFTWAQYSPRVSADPAGNFVVVWSSQTSNGTDPLYSIQGRRYSADGTPAGSESQINTYTTNVQGGPSVEVDSQGDFVVAWSSYGSFGTDASDSSIQARQFDANGAPLGGEFQVNSYTTSHQFGPVVAKGVQGGFVIVWQGSGSSGTDSSGSSIQAQRYDATGAPIDGEFQVNTYTTGAQVDPAVEMDPAGNFLVVWTSDGSSGTDSDRHSIQGRFFDAAGEPFGPEFQVNTYTRNSQLHPAITADSKGDFVVTWQSQGSRGTDTSGYSIQARRYCGLFCDGFESGDASRWSAVAP